VAGLGEGMTVQKWEGRPLVGSSDPHALFIIILSGNFVSAATDAPAATMRGSAANCLSALRRLMLGSPIVVNRSVGDTAAARQPLCYLERQHMPETNAQ